MHFLCAAVSVFVYNLVDIHETCYKIRSVARLRRVLLVHSNAHKVIAGFFLSPDPEVM
jgi:hypothetical protein